MYIEVLESVQAGSGTNSACDIYIKVHAPPALPGPIDESLGALDLDVSGLFSVEAEAPYRLKKEKKFDRTAQAL